MIGDDMDQNSSLQLATRDALEYALTKIQYFELFKSWNRSFIIVILIFIYYILIFILYNVFEINLYSVYKCLINFNLLISQIINSFIL